MSCPDGSPLVPLLHCSAPSPPCPAHSSQPAPGADPCLQLQLREVVIPSPFSLLSAGKHLLSPYSVAQLQIWESSIPPFLHINPQPLLPNPSPLSSIHPREQPALQVMPAHLGASAEVPQVPRHLPATSPGARGFFRHDSGCGVPAHGAQAGGCQHQRSTKSIDCARSQRWIYTENKRSKNEPPLPA